MQSVREKWTDERLDDLNERVTQGFDRVDRDIRDLRTEMNLRFNAMDARFDALHKLLIRAAGGTIAVLATVGAALVATQL
jgi:hypothetical protein